MAPFRVSLPRNWDPLLFKVRTLLCLFVCLFVELVLVPLSHAQKPRDPCHDRSGTEEIPGHMVQVQTCDCKVQRRSANEEGWFLVCVHTTTSQAYKCCDDYRRSEANSSLE